MFTLLFLRCEGLSRTSPTFTNGARFRGFGWVSDLNFCQGLEKLPSFPFILNLDESKRVFATVRIEGGSVVQLE